MITNERKKHTATKQCTVIKNMEVCQVSFHYMYFA